MTTPPAVLFNTLYSQFNRAVERIIRVRLSDAYDDRDSAALSDAQDIAQTVWLRAWQHVQAGKPCGFMWLRQVALNAAIDRIRDRAAHPESRLADIAGPHSEYDPAYDERLHDLDDDAGRDESVAAFVREHVNRLPRSLQQVVKLRFWDGLPLNQVADRLGITHAAARKRLERAKAELLKLMLPEEEE